MEYFTFDPALKKKLLAHIAHSSPAFRKRRILSLILELLGFMIVVGGVVFFSTSAGEQGHTAVPLPILGALTGIVVGCIPFLFGRLAYHTGVREGTWPYSLQESEFLRIGDVGVEFGYHEVGSQDEGSMVVYQIPYENILNYNFSPDSGEMTIVGQGKLIFYRDYVAGKLAADQDGRRFYSNTPYTFLFAFQERERFLNCLNEKRR